jgi:hypothetical protein
MERLLYIGKSNKKFTHNRIYKYHGQIPYGIIVYNNKNTMESFSYNSLNNYFEKNFKFVDEQEYNKIIRKNKLNKINKNI